MKKETMELIKTETRFYLNSPEKAAEALLFIRNLKKFTKEIEESVKERAAKIMDDKGMELVTYSVTDPETGEIREWAVRRDYGTRTKKYRPEIVIKTLGEKAFQFLDVKKTDFDKYLKRESAKGIIPMEMVSEITKDENCDFGIKKGSGVKITEVKVKK